MLEHRPAPTTRRAHASAAWASMGACVIRRGPGHIGVQAGAAARACCRGRCSSNCCQQAPALPTRAARAPPSVLKAGNCTTLSTGTTQLLHPRRSSSRSVAHFAANSNTPPELLGTAQPPTAIQYTRAARDASGPGRITRPAGLAHDLILKYRYKRPYTTLHAAPQLPQAPPGHGPPAACASPSRPSNSFLTAPPVSTNARPP